MDNDVGAAFAMLLDELNEQVEGVRRAAKAAVDAGNFEGARAAVDRAEALHALCCRAMTLEEEWRAVCDGRPLSPEASEPPNGLGRRTPWGDFRRPILAALVALEGQATWREVLVHVEAATRESLSARDLTMRHGIPEWHHATYTARYYLVQDTLLRRREGTQTWEITDAGRQCLDGGADEGGARED